MKDKGNDGKGNIPERDLWETEQNLWDSLNEEFEFTFDCCANESNKKTEHFSNDFLSLNDLSNEVCWMNPPFSKARKMFKHFFKVVEQGVAIYRCDNMETKIWQEVILKKADWIFIPKGRIAYTPFEVGDMRKGKGTRFPSALIGIGVPPSINLKGMILFVQKKEEEE